MANVSLNHRRPWPPPFTPQTMVQKWHDLLFMHWRVDPHQVRHLIPASLELDTYDGSAWVGVVPFRMSGVRFRNLPPFPGTSAFPELNVRTYVTKDGKPGVWFFSLDAASALAVWAARRWFHLPYFRAQFAVNKSEDARSTIAAVALIAACPLRTCASPTNRRAKRSTRSRARLNIS